MIQFNIYSVKGGGNSEKLMGLIFHLDINVAYKEGVQKENRRCIVLVQT